MRGNEEMPTTLGKPFSLDWRGDPPHMLQPDIPVWYRWLDKYKSEILRLWYDSYLGGPILTPEDAKDPYKRMWRATVCKRTDAIAETKDEVWLIEVSAYPGMRALGQLITYQTLWLEDPKINKPERLLLVGESIDQDDTAAYGKMGVLFYVV